MKAVLVTGGAGYIGSHVCKELAKMDLKPITFDNLSRGHKWAVQWGPLVLGDLSNTELISETLKQFEIEAVVHMAALAYVEESVKNPELYYKNNVEGTLSLLEAMDKAKVDQIIFSSSCSVYGNLENVPVTENHKLEPLSPYGESKMIMERVLKEKFPAVRSMSLRYFNAAGADPDGTIGEVHNPETHLIPLVLQCAQGLRETISIYGNDYKTVDGTCIRDYIHVNDIAKAHVLALNKLKTFSKPEVVNLGNGKGYSVLEIIKTAERLTEKKIKTSFQKRRSGDAPILLADASKAKEVLGWEPSHNIESILKTSWNWMRNQTK